MFLPQITLPRLLSFAVSAESVQSQSASSHHRGGSSNQSVGAKHMSRSVTEARDWLSSTVMQAKYGMRRISPSVLQASYNERYLGGCKASEKRFSILPPGPSQPCAPFVAFLARSAISLPLPSSGLSYREVGPDDHIMPL